MNNSHATIQLNHNVKKCRQLAILLLGFQEYAEVLLTFLLILYNVVGCFTCNYVNMIIDREETNTETVTRTLMTYKGLDSSRLFVKTHKTVRAGR